MKNKKKFLIILSKGKNLKESLFYLKKYKINLIKDKNKNRKIYFKSNKKLIYFFIIKNNDFKKYIKTNISDIIFIGEDILLNLKYNIFFNFKFIKINLFFISLISNKKYIFKKNKILFSTKYINILKKYLNFKNIKNNKIIKLSGSIENECILKNNLILDITSSGKTIKDNNIFELKKIMIFKNILIYNKNIIYNKIFYIIKKNYVKKQSNKNWYK